MGRICFNSFELVNVEYIRLVHLKNVLCSRTGIQLHKHNIIQDANKNLLTDAMEIFLTWEKYLLFKSKA